MATNFPGSLDSFTNPTSGSTLDSPSHASQHANINDAVEALEAKVGVDGSAVTSSLDYKVAQQGLTFIKSQTIGSGVSSVTVTGAFSSTFRDYLIIVSQTAGTGAELTFNYDGVTTLYYGAMRYLVYTGSLGTSTRAAGSNMPIGYVSTNAENSYSITVNAPYVTGRTTAHGTFVGGDSNGYFGAFNTNNTSVTGFRLVPSSGTLTGGTIKVYGFNNG